MASSSPLGGCLTDYSGQGNDVGANLVYCRRCLYQGFLNEVLRRPKRLICSFPFQGYYDCLSFRSCDVCFVGVGFLTQCKSIGDMI